MPCYVYKIIGSFNFILDISFFIHSVASLKYLGIKASFRALQRELGDIDSRDKFLTRLTSH